MYSKNDAFLLIKIDYDRIKLLKLEVSAETIRYSILTTPKLKLKPSDVEVVSDTLITVHPNKSQNAQRLNFALSELKDQIPKVVVKVSIVLT